MQSAKKQTQKKCQEEAHRVTTLLLAGLDEQADVLDKEGTPQHLATPQHHSTPQHQTTPSLSNPLVSD